MSSENVWDKGLVSRFRLDGNMGSPFHQRTSALATTNWYFNWDLRMVPDEFVDFAEEVKAVRENVAMADMSPLTKIQITGKDATAAVNWLVTRDINKMEVRQVLFVSPIILLLGLWDDLAKFGFLWIAKQAFHA